MAAFGRKRTFDFVDFGASERPLWRKADIPEYPQDFHKIDQLGTSALPPEAAIGFLIYTESPTPAFPVEFDKLTLCHR